MFKFLSRLKEFIIDDDTKHSVTISQNEVHVDTTPIDQTDYRNYIIHIYGDIDHLQLDGSHTLVVHGNVNGNVWMDGTTWLTCNNINGIVKGDKTHIQNIVPNENENNIICD